MSCYNITERACRIYAASCAWNSDDGCVFKLDLYSQLNFHYPSPFSKALLNARMQCVNASSAGEDKCNAVGPAAPPKEMLEQYIRDAEAMNLTMIPTSNGSTSGANSIFAGATTAVGALAVGFSFLLLLLTGP